MWQGRVLGKAESSQLSPAEECIVQGMELCEELKLRPLCAEGHFLLGELYVDNGQSEKALEKLKRAERMFQKMDMDYWVVKTQRILESL